MEELELARLDELIAAAPGRPGGAYPVAWFALHASARPAIDARLARSPLAHVWERWPDVAARGHALAAYEPALAHVHLAIADLALRDADAHAEPHPELREAVVARVPGYAAVLAELAADFDNDSEMAATRRGFQHSARTASPLFTGDALTCLARGALACHGYGIAGGDLEPAELAEHIWLRDRILTAAELRVLPCPALVTDLRLTGELAGAIEALARAPHLTRLAAATRAELGDAETAALARLPIESLGLSLDADAVLWPRWIARLPALRTLRVAYRDGRTGGPKVDVPAALGACTQLEVLVLDGVGSLPPELANLVRLTSLSVRGWSFTTIPEEVARLPRLATLVVDPTMALNDLPPGFERATALRELRLGHLITPAAPRAVFAMPWLERLYLIHEVAWPPEDFAALRRALPNTKVDFAPSGALARAGMHAS